MYSLAVLSRTPRTALVGFLRKIVGHVKERCLEELCEVKGLVAVDAFLGVEVRGGAYHHAALPRVLLL